MGNLSGGAVWIFAVMACSLLANAQSNATLGISSDRANWELELRIARLQRERDSALNSLALLRGKLERCRRNVYACESRVRTGGRSALKQRRQPGRQSFKDGGRWEKLRQSLSTAAPRRASRSMLMSTPSYMYEAGAPRRLIYIRKSCILPVQTRRILRSNSDVAGKHLKSPSARQSWLHASVVQRFD